MPKGCVKSIKRKMSFSVIYAEVPKATGQYVNISGLPQYYYKTLVDKEEIGIGGFAVVFTAKLPENATIDLGEFH
jgi:hypothetical protein